MNSKENIASFSAWGKRMNDRSANPCELSQDGAHNWQFEARALLGEGYVYRCQCGASEVRK